MGNPNSGRGGLAAEITARVVRLLGQRWPRQRIAALCGIHKEQVYQIERGESPSQREGKGAMRCPGCGRSFYRGCPDPECQPQLNPATREAA